MSVKDHAAYQSENQKLTETIQAIDDYIRQQELPIISQAATSWSAVSVSQIKLKKLEAMKQARPEPYFGRVDIKLLMGDQLETWYIGKIELPELGIYAWQRTIAADYYFYQKSDRDNGRLLLKRTFEINTSQLRAITDEFVDPELAQQLQISIIDSYTDKLLIQLLKKNRSGRLHDIVATIQQQQYRLIQSPLEQLLIIQGAPGSGKTQVALHRVSYLLYHHREDKKVVPNRVLILGPNPIFMKYIEQVLPDLGNRRLQQRTFDEWLLDRLGDKLHYETQDRLLETLLDTSRAPAERIMRYRNAQNKGSLKMGQLLERYIEWLHAQVMVGRENLTCQVRLPGGRVPSITVPVDQVREFLDQTRPFPFNQRRAEVEQRLLRYIREQILQQLKVATLEDRQDKALQEAINTQVRNYFADWPRQNVSVAYRRLLRNPETLYQISAGLFNDWDLELLIQDAPTALIPFRFSDLAALLYFKLLMDGPEQVRYDHIMVDEAQDLTPLHFKVLHSYSRNGSMTILGDLAQSIYPHPSLDNWGNLAEITGSQQPKVETIQHSYRSTRQITQASTELLRRINQKKAFWPEEMERDGPPVQFQGFDHQSNLVKALIQTVTAAQKEGRQSIALVVKAASACQPLAEALRQAGFDHYKFISHRDSSYHGGVAILPTYLTKGLEFDTVILTDANAATYPADTLHARLLYVTMTRAAHSLHVYWTGPLTPILNSKRSKVSLATFLQEARDYRPLTLEAYAAGRPGISAEWCVERLAGSNRLRLLQRGQLDETVLDILLRGSSPTLTSTETIQPLGESRQHTIRNQVTQWQQSNQAKLQDAFVLIETTFGLLQPQLQQVGLSSPGNDPDLLVDRVVLLATLLAACQEQGLSLSSNRWLSHTQAFSALSQKDEPRGKQLLNLFIAYGVVVENTARTKVWIPPERLQGLLALSLGSQPADWDQDLLAQLTLLPQPVILGKVTQSEVSHG